MKALSSSISWVISGALFFLLPSFSVSAPPAGVTGKFSSLPDWDEKVAEVLSYRVQKNYLGEDLSFFSNLVTEAGWFALSDRSWKRSMTEGALPAFHLQFSWTHPHNKYPHSVSASLLCARDDRVSLLRETVTIQDWSYPAAKFFSQDREQPRLSVHSFLEGDRTVDYDQSPVFPWEYFFLWLRAVDLQAGKSLPVWVLPPLTDDVTDAKVKYAEVRLLPGRMRVRGNECLHIEVIFKDGPKGEFWVLAGGLHPVVEARFPDGTTYSLERIDRKRFWDF